MFNDDSTKLSSIINIDIKTGSFEISHQLSQLLAILQKGISIDGL